METKNTDLYISVTKARKAKGLWCYDSTAAIAHPMVGRTVTNLETGKTYNVQKAVRHWHWGWYVALLLECNNSHVLVTWENQSCDEMAKRAEENRARYKVNPVD